MIRRWSHLISLEFDPISYAKIIFKRRFKSFRKAIIFRKFFLKYSKILRKHYARLKHSYNWLIFTQIWQHWISDFLKIKNVAKFHFLKNFNYIEYLSYDPYQFNTKQQKLFASSKHISCGLPRRLFFWNLFMFPQLKSNYFSKIQLNFFNNSFLHFSYLLESSNFEPFRFKPLYIFIERQLISALTLHHLPQPPATIYAVYDIFFKLCIQFLKELYILVSTQWIFVMNFPNNVK